MSKSMPELLNPRVAAAHGDSYRGDLPLATLPRLSSLAETGQLADDQGPGGSQAAYRLTFFRDEQGRDLVEGSVRAQLRLRCQRCTEGYDLPVDACFTLAVVNGLDEAEALPDAYDPLLLEEALIRPRDLVEDELILAVPAVPRHADGDCVMPAEAAGATDGPDERPNPFASLAVLKQTQTRRDED
jgi:uncharacterized protein